MFEALGKRLTLRVLSDTGEVDIRGRDLTLKGVVHCIGHLLREGDEVALSIGRRTDRNLPFDILVEVNFIGGQQSGVLRKNGLIDVSPLRVSRTPLDVEENKEESISQGMRGTLGDFGVHDLVLMMRMRQKTTHIDLQAKGVTGHVKLCKGIVTHASFGSACGESALEIMGELEEGTFDVRFDLPLDLSTSVISDRQQNIDATYEIESLAR